MTYFWDNFSEFGTSIALRDHSDSISYFEFASRIEQFKARLPKKQQLVAIECANTISTIVAYVACLQAHHVPLLLDEGLDSRLKSSLLTRFSPNFLISQEQIVHQSSVTHQFHPDLALLLSTSGSTGSPKLVRLSRQNLVANTRSIIEYLQIRSSDIAITVLPLHYSFGLSVINTHLAVGAQLSVSDASIMSKPFWDMVKSHQVTTLSGVPYTFELLKKLRFERMTIPTIRYLAQAGGRLDPDTTHHFVTHCKANRQSFFTMYGQTEATARISYLDATASPDKIGSIGRAIPNGTLSLVDVNGTTIGAANVEGELVYRGPNVMMGYAESAQDLSLNDTCNGELLTGDMAVIDAEGIYWITGRKKRFIKLFGNRLSLDEIDQFLTQMDIQGVSGGNDDLLQVACYMPTKAPSEIAQTIADTYKINVNSILVFEVPELYRMSSGKLDYNKIFQP